MNYNIPATEIINELVDIHDAISLKYRLALLHPRGLEGDMKTIFERIAKESRQCRNELAKSVEVYMELPEQISTLENLTTIMSTGDRKAILAYCANDVKEVLDIYSEAIAEEKMRPDWRALILRQYTNIANLYAHIRQLHDAQ